jgi:hypothetical protein
MAPAEVSESTTSPLGHLKVINRAMEFPVVSDTIGGMAKYAESIRYNHVHSVLVFIPEIDFFQFIDTLLDLSTRKGTVSRDSEGLHVQ